MAMGITDKDASEAVDKLESADGENVAAEAAETAAGAAETGETANARDGSEHGGGAEVEAGGSVARAKKTAEAEPVAGGGAESPRTDKGEERKAGARAKAESRSAKGGDAARPGGRGATLEELIAENPSEKIDLGANPDDASTYGEEEEANAAVRAKGDEAAELKRQIEELDALMRELCEVESEEEFAAAEITNDDDSAEKSEEVGVGFKYDRYGREILKPAFENCLRMSKNRVKTAYSKLKNEILGHVGMKQRYDGRREVFSHDGEILFAFEVMGEDLCVNSAMIENPSIATYGLTVQDNPTYSEAPLQVAIKNDSGAKREGASRAEADDGASGVEAIRREREEKSEGASEPEVGGEAAASETDESESVRNGDSYDKALALVRKVLEERGIPENPDYARVMYAARYPVNPLAVLEGREMLKPEEGAYDSDEYAPLDGETETNALSMLDEEFGDAVELIQTAETDKEVAALTEPIVYFYDCAVNKDNSVSYVHVTQVLNDRFLGKILPQQYFSVAENSDRIEALNLQCLDRVAEDARRNDSLVFMTEISARLLFRAESVDRITERLDGVRNVVLAFDGALIEAGGTQVFKAVERIKSRGLGILLHNMEGCGFRALTELPIDCIRLDARHYGEASASRLAYLDVLTGYCRALGISTICASAQSVKEARFLFEHGIETLQGHIVSEPKRMISTAVKCIKKLPA